MTPGADRIIMGHNGTSSPFPFPLPFRVMSIIGPPGDEPSTALRTVAEMVTHFTEFRKIGGCSKYGDDIDGIWIRLGLGKNFDRDERLYRLVQ